jgi:hypothetical protein
MHRRRRYSGVRMSRARPPLLAWLSLCLLATACEPSATPHGTASVTPTATPAPFTPAVTPPPLIATAPAAGSGLTVIRGQVRDGRPLVNYPNLVIPNDLPIVAGATVRIVNLGLSATSDRAGQFSFPGIRVASPCIKIDVAASSPGFGTWQIHGAPIYPGVGSELYIQLDVANHAETYSAGGAAAAGLAACH